MGDRPDDADARGQVEYGLVMPFVAVRSQGGPYDDQPFVAGYQVGHIDQALAVVRLLGLTAASVQHGVYRPLLDQLDLVAMRHGYRMRSTDMVAGDDTTTWSAVEFFDPPRADPPGSRVTDHG